MKRRAFLLGGFAIAGVLGLAGANRMTFYSMVTEPRSGEVVDAAEAYELVESGDLVLVDIRRPDEWLKTGRALGSVPIDMRRDDFTDELSRIVNGKNNTRIALICARGVRSARLSNRLIEAGFDNIVDVPEGMLGSESGPGWIARGLPLVEG
ncbi:MAG: rhodanese-like domain-containing protein [Pseudomonadota bacterium]